MSGNTPNTETNPQIVDAVTRTNALVVGVARGQSLALSYEALANAVSLMMLNSTQNQFGSQKVEVAMVAATSAKILAAAD